MLLWFQSSKHWLQLPEDVLIHCSSLCYPKVWMKSSRKWFSWGIDPKCCPFYGKIRVCLGELHTCVSLSDQCACNLAACCSCGSCLHLCPVYVTPAWGKQGGGQHSLLEGHPPLWLTTPHTQRQHTHTDTHTQANRHTPSLATFISGLPTANTPFWGERQISSCKFGNITGLTLKIKNHNTTSSANTKSQMIIRG